MFMISRLAGCSSTAISDLLQMITQGETYAIYYLDPDKTILSLERIAKN